MDVKLANGVAVRALTVFGGKEQYQNARREYLEFIFLQDGNTLEALEALLAVEQCSEILLVDVENEVQYAHSGYVLRGPARVWRDEESGRWQIGLKRYQQTALEREVAALRQAVAAMGQAQGE